jgi:omega-amidase
MEELRVTLLQNNLYWENIEANLAQFEEQIWEHNTPTDLIVLPEMFTTGFSGRAKELGEPMNSKTFRWMKQHAEQQDAVVCGSYIVNEHGLFYNRFLAVYPDASFSYYDKRHLFAMGGEGDPYRSGQDRVIFDVKGWKVFPSICYDLRFPVWSRQSPKYDYEYDLLVYVANWPKPRINAWDTLLSARAIENQAYSVGVNRVGKDDNGLDYVGHSNAYDFLGNSLLDVNEEVSAQTITLDPQSLNEFRTKFPFNKEADQFTID